MERVWPHKTSVLYRTTPHYFMYIFWEHQCNIKSCIKMLLHGNTFACQLHLLNEVSIRMFCSSRVLEFIRYCEFVSSL